YNMKKYFYIVILITSIILLLLALIIVSFFQNINDAIIKLSCSVIGILIPIDIRYIQNMTDKMPWETYLRFLLRKKQINKDTQIRISFSTFYRIRVDDTFLLIRNIYGISEFQIPGYTYRLSLQEKNYLVKEYGVTSDNRIPNKEIKDDYRLFVKAKNIKKFYKRFNNQFDYKKGEYIKDYFEKLFIKNDYLPQELFSNVDYYFVKRDVNPVSYSPYFSCYELMLRDVYEIELNQDQLNYLRELKNNNSRTNNYYFAKSDEIKTRGVDYKNGKFDSFISQHTMLLLDDND
ncbi:MAG: hypothetical protein K6E20_02885, partial [Acholeplasmatales bacterium]|nr:hypothetical protein [Acholeplasmatales bacterium]